MTSVAGRSHANAPGIAAGDGGRPRHPLRQDEPAGGDREERQQPEHRRGRAVGPQPALRSRRALGRERVRRAPDAHRGGAGPALPGPHAPEDRGSGCDLGMPADPRSRRQGAAGADRGAGADPDAADPHGVAVDPVAREVDLRLDRRAVGDLEHPGDRRKGMQVDVRPQLRAERAGVVADPRRPRQAHGVHLVRDLLGEPQPEVHSSAPRVVAGPHARRAGAGRPLRMSPSCRAV